jgi:predicted TPR repeat methyltransferase
VLTIAAYAPVRDFGFISMDDPQYVSANPIVGQGLTWRGVGWAFTGSHGFYWHPLTWLSHQLDVQLFGMDAGSHHMVSLLFHVMNSLLLYLALARMTGAIGRSAFVTAMFALHPLHVESVAWIAERKDVLSTFFALLAILGYVHFARHRQRNDLVLVIACFACALMAKPMVVTLPLVLLLLDFWPLRRAEFGSDARAWWLLLREKLPLFGLALAASAITIVAQRRAGAVIPLTSLSLVGRVENASVSYAAYARDMLWPAHLAVFYPLQPPGALAAAAALALLISVTVVAWRLRHRAPYLLMGLLWYIVTLAPVIGLVQAGDQGRADRFTYVPIVGLFVIVAWGLDDLARVVRLPRPALALAAAGLVMVCVAATREQVSYWESNLSLWGRTVTVTSQNYRAEDRLGVALADAGRLDQAVAHYAAALAIWPQFAEAHNNLGTARVDQGRTEDAIHEFGEAARINPNEPMFHYNLAVVLNTAGRTSDAIREVKAALRLRPDDSSFARALSVISAGAGK